LTSPETACYLRALACLLSHCISHLVRSRDSYNPSNLLWLFGLSWWQDVLDVLVDKDGKMSPRNAERFLQMLADRAPVFEANLKKVKPAKGETRAEVEEYFRGKYERLKAFLRQAIDRKESIQCSL
jgi:hypothetical protein